jgi:HAD superfamily hydrolase (TIGR01549 family)
VRIDPRGIDAVTFDFYNTLVYHRQGRGRGAAVMEYLEAQGWPSDPWEHQVLYDAFARHGTEYDPAWSEENKQQYHRRLAGRLFQLLNVRAPDGAAVAHASHIWELLGPASLAVFPDVPDVLRRLRGAGYPLAVVSNWQCGLRHFCTELGIGDVFDHVLASAEVASQKPDTGIFGEASRRLGVPPHRILHVGDSIVDDIEGAGAAGMQALLVRRDDDGPPAGVPVIRGFGELADVLGAGSREQGAAEGEK